MTVKHLFALLLLTCHLAHAQERLSISGKVTNATAQPVSNAFIHLLNTNFTAFTDEQGQFTLTSLEPGEYEVVVSAMGHATLNKRITVARDAAPLNFSLAASFAQLDAVIVTAQKQEENVQAVPSAISALRRKDV
jgi:iron complex outermembrane recepter protein